MIICKKKAFKTEAEAKKFNKGMEPYLCKICEGMVWHLWSGGRSKIFQATGGHRAAFAWAEKHTWSKKKKSKQEKKIFSITHLSCSGVESRNVQLPRIAQRHAVQVLEPGITVDEATGLQLNF